MPPNAVSPNAEDDQPAARSVRQVARFSTGDGGKASVSVDNVPADNDSATDNVSADHVSADNVATDGASDPVKAALAGAQRIVRTSPSRRRPQRGKSRGEQPGPARGGYSGAGPDGTDPAPVGDVLSGYLADRGWERPLSEARVFSDWAAIVGADIAAHCSPAALHAGELKLTAESTAWATQLRLLGARLLARIVAEVGPGVVTRVRVTGPVAPSWQHGTRRVHGGQGPRDTYG